MKKSAEQIFPEYLDMDVLSSLPELELQARFLVGGFMSGLHHSPLKGGSAEFKEYRDYQPGDDLKLIDWKVYARNDRLHIRLREEESDMNVYILLDKSASMNYKSSKALMTKWSYARALAAAFLYFLKQQRDNVSLSFSGNGLESYQHPSARPVHIRGLMNSLETEADSLKSETTQALESLAALVKKRSILIVISDFYTELSALENTLKTFRHLNCETILMHVLDPAECDFSFKEPLILKELELQTKMTVSPDLFAEAYRKSLKKHIQTLADMVTESAKGSYVLLRTDEVPLKALGEYLYRREKLI